MPEFDWEPIGADFLDRDVRPTLVLDAGGRILRANRAATTLFQLDARESAGFFVELVAPTSRPQHALAWLKALAGESSRAAVSLKQTEQQFEPVFEYRPVLARGLAKAVILVMVETMTRGPTVPPVPAVGLHYEVLLDSDGSPQRVLRALATDRELRLDPGATCYRVLRGLDRPCGHCPVLQPGAARVLRASTTHTFSAELTWARRTSPDRALVSAVPLDEEAYSAIFKARIESLAARAQLTTREKQVFELLLLGRSLAEIGAIEGITARTAKYHQERLLEKLGAESRLDLFRLLA